MKNFVVEYHCMFNMDRIINFTILKKYEKVKFDRLALYQTCVWEAWPSG